MSEKRQPSHRLKLKPRHIEGVITVRQTGLHGVFRIWDVSRNGLGIWTSVALSEADIVTIAVSQPFVLVLDATIKWVKPHGEGYRVGLRVSDKPKALSSLWKVFEELQQSA